MTPFRIEGPVCFANVPPGFEIRYELYDLYPDGSKNMAITIRPMPPDEPEEETLTDILGEALREAK